MPNHLLYIPLRLCFLAVLRLTLFLLSLRLCGENALAFAHSAASSLAPAERALTLVRRWQQPGNPLHLCHFSGISRVSRRHKMHIRRLAPSHPPAILAEVVQIVQ